MTLPPNRMSGRAMNEAAWRERKDIADRIVARLAASPCTLGRLIADLSIPTSAATVLLGKLTAERVIARVSNSSPCYCLAQEARAA